MLRSFPVRLLATIGRFGSATRPRSISSKRAWIAFRIFAARSRRSLQNLRGITCGPGAGVGLRNIRSNSYVIPSLSRDLSTAEHVTQVGEVLRSSAPLHCAQDDSLGAKGGPRSAKVRCQNLMSGLAS